MNRIAWIGTVAAVVIGLGCGGAGKPAAAIASGTALESPSERCLAIADAKRDRRTDEPARIVAKHVLVRYAGAKNAPPSITRTREEACLRAMEARKKLEQGASFGEVVSAYSDESGAATRDGAVGSITRGDVAPSFADAAFELHAGEVSHVVESPFGFHLVLRAE